MKKTDQEACFSFHGIAEETLAREREREDLEHVDLSVEETRCTNDVVSVAILESSKLGSLTIAIDHPQSSNLQPSLLQSASYSLSLSLV